MQVVTLKSIQIGWIELGVTHDFSRRLSLNVYVFIFRTLLRTHIMRKRQNEYHPTCHVLAFLPLGRSLILN